MPGFGAGAQAIPGAAGESARQQPKAMCGNLNYGSKGYVAMSGYDTYRSWLGESQERGPTATCGENRWANFLDCVRTHAPEKVHAPIQAAHASCALIHLANASYGLGRTLRFDSVSERVIGDGEANQTLRGTYREPYVAPEKV
jgi:hypothetical protein